MQLSERVACTVHVTNLTYEGAGRAKQGGGRVSCALRHSHVEIGRPLGEFYMCAFKFR